MGKENFAPPPLSKGVRNILPSDTIVQSVSSRFLMYLCCAFAKLQKKKDQIYHVCPSHYVSVFLSAWNNSTPVGGIFIKFDFEYYSKLLENIHLSLQCDKNNGCFEYRILQIFDNI